MNRISKHLGTALIAASLVAGVGFSATAGAGEIVKERVKVADLDLDTVRGQRILERRVQAAVGRVCTAPVAVPTYTNRSKRDVAECRRDALEMVQDQLEARGIASASLASRD